jgi:hypothetical protein
MVLIAPDGALHVSDMLTPQPQTALSLIASERREARSAINSPSPTNLSKNPPVQPDSQLELSLAIFYNLQLLYQNQQL